MKTNDILSAVKNTDKKYVTEAAEENVTRKFAKKPWKKILSTAASVAALTAFAAFVVVTVSLANRRDNINPAAVSAAEDTVYESTVTEAEENAASEPETGPGITDSGDFKAIADTVSFTESTATIKATVYDGAHNVKADNSAEVPVYTLEAEAAEAKPAADFDVFVHGSKFLREKDGSLVMRRADHTILTTYENGATKWVYELSPEEYITNWFAVSDGTVVAVSSENVFMIRKLDLNGNLLWDHKVDSKHSVTHADAPIAVYEKDGEIYALSVVFNDEYDSRGTLDSAVNTGMKAADVIIRVLSSDKGELLKETMQTLRITKTGMSAACIYACDDGFVLSSLTDTGKSLIVYIGLDGTLKHIFTLETEGLSYYYYAAAIQGSRLYLSAMALKDGARLHTPDYEQIDIVGFDFNGEPDAELLSAAKAERSAALIAVDLGSCAVKAIYSANAGFGGTIKETADGFIWQLCKINGGFTFEPYNETSYPLTTASASDCIFEKNGELVFVTPSDTAYTQIESD